MATGLRIDLSTGCGTVEEVADRPPSPLLAAEHRRAMALERLRQAAAEGGVVEDLLIVLGLRDG
jgi:hypothetical protein